MKFKFYNETMGLEEFLTLNWYDLPEQIRSVATRSTGGFSDLAQLTDTIEDLEQRKRWS